MNIVETNKWYFNGSGNEAIFITDVIDYEGTKEIAINYTTGFGVSEKRDRIIIPYSKYEEFKRNLKLKNRTMENNNVQDKNNFKELREVLFDTLRGIKSGEIDISKAKSISDISQTLINTAKVEIDYIKVTGNKNKTTMIQ